MSIDYTLTDEDGTVLDSSEGEEPLAYVHGTGSLVDGLEAALEGKGPSDRVSITLPPERAYGVHDDSVVFTVPRSQFHEADGLVVGMQFQVQSDGEGHMVTVARIDEEEITLDGNHPLAGRTLHFDVEIVDVREATPDEIEHGHVHDGHSHHEH